VSGRLLILGAGGHARAVADLAVECGWTVAGFTERPGATGPAVVGDDADLPRLLASGGFDGAIVGVGNTALERRAELFRSLKEAGATVPTLVHPRAAVSRSCRIGEGSVVFPGVVLGSHVRVGINAVVYSGVVAEHDCAIADHAYLSPGVILCGGVTVQAGAFIGAGAVVVPGVTLEEGTRVRAGAVVSADVLAKRSGPRQPGLPTG